MNDEKRRRALELMKKYYGGIVESENKIVPPELETVSISGTILNFNTDISRPLENLILHLEPTQSGAGDPSPSNIRPISGYDAVNVYRSSADTSNPTVYNISLSNAGTVYGGSLDVTTGELTVTHVGMRLTSSNQTWASAGSVGSGYRFYSRLSPACATSARQIMTSHWYYESGNNGNWGTYQVYNGFLFVKNQNGEEGLTSWQAFMNWLDANDAQICYPLATPITYQLTPTEVTTLLGDNTIWMDAEGTIDAEYWRIKQ